MYRRDFLSLFPAGSGLLADTITNFTTASSQSEEKTATTRTKFIEAKGKALFWSDMPFGSVVTLPRLLDAWDLSSLSATSEEKALIFSQLSSARFCVSHSQKMVKEWDDNSGSNRPMDEIAQALLWVGQYREAIKLFYNLLENIPKEKSSYRENIYLGMIHAHYCLGEFQTGFELIKDFRGATGQSDLTWEEFRYRIFLLCAIPEPQQARVEAQRFIKWTGQMYRNRAVSYALASVGIDLHDMYLELNTERIG